MLPQVRQWLSRPKGLFIGGAWTDASSGRTFETRDPATGQVLTEVAHGEAVDVDRAVRAARKAFEGEWSLWTPAQRQRLLFRIGEAIYEHAEELAQLEALDNGKSAAVVQAVDVTWVAIGHAGCYCPCQEGNAPFRFDNLSGQPAYQVQAYRSAQSEIDCPEAASD
ncbi:MAG: aldehyde dehydrogenase family protein [Nocardioides sp.]